MEKGPRDIPIFSFTKQLEVVQTLLDSGKITETQAIKANAISAATTLLRLGKGAKVEGEYCAFDFLDKNWHKIPEGTRYRINHSK